MFEPTEADIKHLENQVVEEARKLRAANPHMTWKYSLSYVAGILCDGWEWDIAEFIGPNLENATFYLRRYLHA